MKKIAFLIWILSGLPLGIFAQTEQQMNLSPKMAAFKEYCIRVANAAATCNTDVLTQCIEQWMPAEYDANGNVKEGKEEKFVYNKELINYIQFGMLERVDTSQEAITGIHFQFIPAAVDTVIVNQCEPVELAFAHILRAGEKHLEFAVRALKAKGKATYATHGAGQIEMFVVAENGGKINLSIHSVEKNYNGTIITNETNLSDNSGAQTAQLTWHMNRNGRIEFTVENVDEKETSFIVVKKL